MRLIPGLILSLFALAVTGCVTPQHRSDIDTAVAATAGQEIERKMLRGSALSGDDIILLSRKDVPDDVIIRLIARSSAMYKMDTESVKQLEEAGVSTSVIDAMLATRTQYRPAYVPSYHHGFRHHRFHHRRHFHHRRGGFRGSYFYHHY